ncbi:sigma 54-interacting transcriptional regulator [Salisediminibacterium halotolerans]|uniref:sigma 54-interacting transcriptional regulator n=1 Tax=Salisediminibacterium halotolerans TaxID=517425 RepID=UPI000EB06507|nr:sigma 54-interacting transcriptional regulator [Salisediminibacterium halotolerans]RLJ69694.1 sigma 54 modulation protein [Actinophytocola xinjiangensis]RPE89752.1 sigma 54 modulation protein [Salisediminibacterium halotolerans]TWG32588.1 sigma 54 modulation protein [Salisediminibacterium halotolerans]GEL08087.1 ArsR family transcriptional regulator [Salisediminibacterium halotolerans]
MERADDVLQTLEAMYEEDPESVTAMSVAKRLQLERSTASRYLNELVKAGKIEKKRGRPVKYRPLSEDTVHVEPVNALTENIPMIGATESLEEVIEKGLAALLYPSSPLHLLLSGETGAGKSFLAETIYDIAVQHHNLDPKTPFVTFNCADYAQNPELLVGQIFGIKKGAFTGATQDEFGLVAKADGGVLFLDEIHRLPSSGQEMLFSLIDKGVYRRLGEATLDRHATVTIIGATTEAIERSLLDTLLRRFSFKLRIPSLRERTVDERSEFIHYFLAQESHKMGRQIALDREAYNRFLRYRCSGNIGQLKSDIQIACAQAFLRFMNGGTQVIVKPADLPDYVRPEAEDVPKVHENTYLEIASDVPNGKAGNARKMPTIYERLLTKRDQLGEADANELDHELRQEVNRYISQLVQRSEEHLHLNNWGQYIDEDITATLRGEADEIRKQEGFDVNLNQIFVLSLHIQAYRDRILSEEPIRFFPEIGRTEAKYHRAAKMLATALRDKNNLLLPEEEITLLAHLFVPHSEAFDRSASITVLITSLGECTASSMSDVANHLLGSPVTVSLDRPLAAPVEQTKAYLEKVIRKQPHSEGMLILTDIDLPAELKNVLTSAAQPYKLIPNVHLNMVTEAGRKVMTPHYTLEGISEELQALNPGEHVAGNPSALQNKPRFIATVCFTGERTASFLKHWIEQSLSFDDQDVVIEAVQIDPVARNTDRIYEIMEVYSIIAIVGTVPVHVGNVPFIPAWEVLRDEKSSRLYDIVLSTRPEAVTPAEANSYEPVQFAEVLDLIMKGLSEIVEKLDVSLYISVLKQHIHSLRQHFRWDPEREIGIMMHLGMLTDRVLMEQQTGLVYTSESRRIDIHSLALPAGDLHLWNLVLAALEEANSIHYPNDAAAEMTALSQPATVLEST